MNVDCLVLGGGVAGMTAAQALYRLGHHTLLLEKSTELGGWARRWACKADAACLQCWVCTADRIARNGTGPETVVGAALSEVVPREDGYQVRFQTGGRTREVQAATLLVAVGFTPYRPAGPEAHRFGYGTFPNVMTGDELEETLRREGGLESKGAGSISRVAFIQCQGSRNERLGRGYCSQVCCGYALRAALALKQRNPVLEVSFFYMDVQLLGKDTAHHLPRCEASLRMIRGLPGEVFEERDHRLSLSYESMEGRPVAELFDRVVLSVGMAPAEDTGRLAGQLGLARDEEGFFSLPSARDRLFQAGACTGPKNIPQSIAQAEQAAWAVYRRLSSG